MASEFFSTSTDVNTLFSTSKVLSFPDFSSFIRSVLISKPTTEYLVANNLANGSPT